MPANTQPGNEGGDRDRDTIPLPVLRPGPEPRRVTRRRASKARRAAVTRVSVLCTLNIASLLGLAVSVYGATMLVQPGGATPAAWGAAGLALICIGTFFITWIDIDESTRRRQQRRTLATAVLAERRHDSMMGFTLIKNHEEVGVSYDAETMLRHSGITYRQLDHWTSKGYLEVSQIGSRRLWPRSEAAAATLLHAFTRVGIRPEIGITYVRHFLKDGALATSVMEVFPGIKIVLRNMAIIDEGLKERKT